MPRPRHRKRAEAALAAGEPVRADQIRLAASKDVDDDVRTAGPNPKTSKRTNGTKAKTYRRRLRASRRQQLILVACSEPLWSLAEVIQVLLDAHDDGRRGPKRTWGAADALVYDAAIEINESANEVDALFFPDPDAGPCVSLWTELCAAVVKAWPDDPRRRLSPVPFDRYKHHRVRTAFIDDDAVDRLRARLRDMYVRAALEMGALDPQSGSRSYPGATQILAGDGSWLRAIYSNTDPKAVDPATGKPRRVDPDAMPYHHNDGTLASAPGHLLVLLVSRTRFPQERLIMDHCFKDPAGGTKGDATIAVDMVLDLLDTYPDELKDTLRGLAYDMALRATDHDRLLDAGLIGISKTPRTSRNQLPSINLGQRKFTNHDDNKRLLQVIVISGTPTVTCIDGNGDLWYVPLKRRRLKHSKHTIATTIYAEYALPDNDLIDHELRGATTLIRLNSTLDERNAKPHKRRTRVIRAIPQSDPMFDDLFGLREDSESTFRHLKRHMPDNRCKTATRTYVDYGIMGFRLKNIATALVAFRKRTGANLSHWFGRLFDRE